MSNSGAFFLDVVDRHKPQKSWGWEEWIVNNEMYCGKRLHFTRNGGCTSLHFHVKKHETMYIESGEFEITLIDCKNGTDRKLHLTHGQSIEIQAFLPHRITCVSDEAVMIEFSTHHEDTDSYRIAP